MAGLLTRPFLSLPVVMTVALISGNMCGHTAAGTVPAFHRIPFSIAQPGGTAITIIIAKIQKHSVNHIHLPGKLLLRNLREYIRCMVFAHANKVNISGRSSKSLTMPLLTLHELEKMTPLFRGRCGNAICRKLMHLLEIDKVNNLYDRYSDRHGPAFARAVLEDIGVEYEILHPEMLLSLPDGPFITISNHPYGHMDGVMLVDLFGHIRPDFKVMVNKFLGRIGTLEDNFICVTPTGVKRTAPTKESIQGIKDAVAHIRCGGALGLFPAGAVSDLSLKDRCIRDREWQEPVIRLIKKLNVPVIPVHFLDRNSDFYYSLGLIDWKIRLLRLIPEVFNKRGKRTRIAIGEIITPEKQREFNDICAFRDFLRYEVYKQ